VVSLSDANRQFAVVIYGVDVWSAEQTCRRSNDGQNIDEVVSPLRR